MGGSEKLAFKLVKRLTDCYPLIKKKVKNILFKQLPSPEALMD